MIGDVVDRLRRDPAFVAWLGTRSQALCAVGIARRWPGAACWALFSGRSETPVTIVKVAAKQAYARRLRSEHDALRRLAQRDEVADSVPRALALLEFDDRLVFAQTAVGGSQMNMAVSRRWRTTARGAAHDHERVVAWLARLHSLASGESERVDSRRVSEQVDRVLEGTPRRRETLSHVAALSREWPDATLPTLPGHGDLTPANCFLDRDRLSVIDWEDGLSLRTPLADLVTFLVEYARWASPARRPPLDRPTALQAAFLGEGWLAELTERTFRPTRARPAARGRGVLVHRDARRARDGSGADRAPASRSGLLGGRAPPLFARARVLAPSGLRPRRDEATRKAEILNSRTSGSSMRWAVLGSNQ